MHHHKLRPSGQGALQARQLALQTIHGVDDIGAGLFLHIEHNGRAPVVPAADPGVLQAINNFGHITQHDRGIVAIGDHDGAIGLGGADLVVGGDGVGLLGAIQRALGPRDISADDGEPQILQPEAIGGEARKVGLNAHRRAHAALN